MKRDMNSPRMPYLMNGPARASHEQANGNEDTHDRELRAREKRRDATKAARSRVNASEARAVTEPAKTEGAGRAPFPGAPRHLEAALRARSAQQSALIEELRGDVARLIDELVLRDNELERALTQLVATDLSEEDRDRLAYRCMVQRLRRLVSERAPRGRPCAVVSSGDNSLLRFATCKAQHLSQDQLGCYVGAHPRSSRAAIAQLEAARSRGTQLLVIPRSGRWWLQRYREFARYLERRYALAVAEEDTGDVWDLQSPSPFRELDDLITALSVGRASQPVILDWHTGQDLAARFSECNVFAPAGDAAVLPYLDGTVDVIAIGDPTPERVAEARRVAADLVVEVNGSQSQPSVEVLWQAEPDERRSDHTSLVVSHSDGKPPPLALLHQLEETIPSSLACEVVLPIGSRVKVAAPSERVRIVRCRDSDTFAQRVRRAAERATGQVLVVVDGSIWPVAGWLPPLVHVLRHVPRAGVVTGMLVTPDGCVAQGLPGPQDGDATPSADDEDPGSAGNSYVRRLNTVSGALFATHRDLFLEHGKPWLQGREPAAAFCAAVVKRGMRILRQPETLAITPWRDAGTRSR